MSSPAAVSPAPPSTSSRTLTVALIGNPNTGKSTLFNALTGGNAHTGNFPGVTVEKKIGRFSHAGREIQVVDLPGTYSLAARSADEQVSAEVLLGRRAPTPDGIVCIVDAVNLERNLYLFSQLRELGRPLCLVLNRWDQAQKQGLSIDVKALEQRLQTPVIMTAAHRRVGVEDVRAAVARLADVETVSPPEIMPAAFQEECAALQTALAAMKLALSHFEVQRVLLDVHGASEAQSVQRGGDAVRELLQASRDRLAAAGCRVPAIETRIRYRWIREVLDGVIERKHSASATTTSDRIDRIVTHPVAGLILFALLMLAVFQVITAGAEPLMNAVAAGQGFAAEAVASVLGPGALRSLINDGVIAGVGAVVVFLPQILLLFLFIAVMEDCGYMARAACLMDKLMTRVGLSGKAFLPLMSSFACAIPGIMATRVIENRRDRMVTMLVAPLMSCSARLPVYLLMVWTFIPGLTWWSGWVDLRGLVLFGMYSVGVLAAIPMAWVLKRTAFRGETPPFVMELPNYQWPHPPGVLRRVYEAGRAFLVRAGSLIFLLTILIWAAGYFPADRSLAQSLTAEREQLGDDEVESVRAAELDEQLNAINAQLVRDSYLGQAGQALEPVVRPLGWDWRIGVGALASFPAREVIISTLGAIFSLGGEIDEEDPSLQQALQAATWPDGRPLFTIPVALSVMVFFALCAQCGATLMVIQRESNSWRWPAFTFFYMTSLAYVAAWATYQLGSRLTG